MTQLHGHSINVATDGPEDGAPVLMLHSSGLSGRQWKPYSRALAEEGWRCVRPDFIAYGESGAWRGPGPFHFHTDLRAMEQLASTLEGPITLVGHSYGGMIALQLAAAIPPERLRAVVVYEPVVWGVLYPESEEMLEKFEEDRFFDDAAGGSVEWVQSFVDFWNGDGAFAQLGDPARDAMLASSRKMFEEVRALCYDWTPPEHYASITCPVLVLHGDRSPPPIIRTCEILSESLVNAERRVVEKAGHLGAVLRAPALAPLVAEWLRPLR